MSAGTIHTASEVEGKRISAIAAFAGLSVEVKESTSTIVKTPTFITSAIGRYIASLAPNSTLIGNEATDAALVDQWVAFVDSTIAHNNSLILQLVKGVINPYNKPIHTVFLDRLTSSLTIIEKHLDTHTFLATERITLADIALAAELQSAFSTTVDSALRAKFPNVLRHFETIVNQPKIASVFGSTTFAEKALQYVPPLKEKKEKAPAAPAQPKAEKKPKKEEIDEEDDDKPYEEAPKEKNPLDLLPKSTFNLEDWKRAYSNKETRGAGGSLEWFYQNFDKEGFSLWRVDFKYNEELTQTYMSSNQIGGFFNRLEASRKYLFGSVGVLGTANNSIIAGALVARGPEIKPVVEVAPDWESYTYERIDLENVEQKAFFEAALAWDLEVGDKKWVDGKNVRQASFQLNLSHGQFSDVEKQFK
ncbi:elongation factor 1-gamma [Multifurca ochricompacta]|uniref:Elongation factor 1-gamma n=1 Tax=Multifurca ochricompacta TaxID=376703 RepID=A0AAD4M249_9AGAM|nr:elongation factor 1-gamma [Multifurca ochricompacta]